jgi:glycosyltransferase involved in cell wall biosynthesis
MNPAQHFSPAEARKSPLRVLAFPKAGGNAYLGSFSNSLEAGGARVDEFNFRRAFLGSYDVVHIHWPDTHLRTHSWWRAVGKHARLALMCLVLRARGTRVIWMMHNLKPHEKDHWISSALFPLWFPRLCTHVIALTAHGLQAARQLYPALHDKPAAIVPHGHYREVYPNIPSRAAARRQLGLAPDRFTFLFFGNIRRYKNVPLLIRTFRNLQDRDVQLVVAGLPVLGMTAEDLQALAGDDDRIHLHLKFVPDEEVALYLAAADKVILPFDSILNSGSVLLALSLNRAVMAPRLGSLPEIEAQVGRRWLQLYDGELTPQLLRQARTDTGAPAEHERPDLSAFDWDAIARTTLEFYRARRIDATAGKSSSAPLRESP